MVYLMSTFERRRNEAAPPFDSTADSLLANGYSPVALVRKRPVDGNWTRWCRTAPTAQEIAASKGRRYNIGAAMGRNGAAGIDIDTDNAEIIAAIRSVIGASTVAKRGQKGRTDFYRVRGGRVLASRQFLGKDGKVIVEVLADGRQSAIPPSIHPDTGMSYQWSTPATLLDTPVDRLPECPDDIIERLEDVLKPWLRVSSKSRPQRSGSTPILDDSMKERLRAWALKTLRRRIKELQAKGKPGRNRELFALVCSLGVFVHHGIITDAELREPALKACDQNGLAKKDGWNDCEKTIDNGLRRSIGDVLRDLPEQRRQTRQRSSQSAADVAAPNTKPDGAEEPNGEPPPATSSAACPANEDAIASAFADRHGDELRYCHDWGVWLRWDGCRWERERCKLAFHYARQLAREANPDNKATPAKASTAHGVERFAQADPRLATVSEDWDRDPWLLATPTGGDGS